MKYSTPNEEVTQFWPAGGTGQSTLYFLMGSCGSCAMNSIRDLNRFAGLGPCQFLFLNADEKEVSSLKLKWPKVVFGTYDDQMARELGADFAPRVYMVDAAGNTSTIQPMPMLEDELFNYLRRGK